MKCKCRISMNHGDCRKEAIVLDQDTSCVVTQCYCDEDKNFLSHNFHFWILISGFSLNINEKISTKYSAAAFVVRSTISALLCDVRFIDTKMFLPVIVISLQ